MRRGETGSATLEFALVLPLALIVALALVQVALVSRDASLVLLAAREGAREAAVSTDDESVRRAVLRNGLVSDRANVSVQRAGSIGDPVTVRVAYSAPVVVPFVGWLFPDEVELIAQATMRQEAGELDLP